MDNLIFIPLFSFPDKNWMSSGFPTSFCFGLSEPSFSWGIHIYYLITVNTFNVLVWWKKKKKKLLVKQSRPKQRRKQISWQYEDSLKNVFKITRKKIIFFGGSFRKIVISLLIIKIMKHFPFLPMDSACVQMKIGSSRLSEALDFLIVIFRKISFTSFWNTLRMKYN